MTREQFIEVYLLGFGDSCEGDNGEYRNQELTLETQAALAYDVWAEKNQHPTTEELAAFRSGYTIDAIKSFRRRTDSTINEALQLFRRLS